MNRFETNKQKKIKQVFFFMAYFFFCFLTSPALNYLTPFLFKTVYEQSPWLLLATLQSLIYNTTFQNS